MATDAQPLDIFGKPLEITEQEKAVLGLDLRVFLRRVLQIETHAKRGDQTEPKTLVISSSRCHVISHKPVKLETSFNFLKITLLECSEKKLVFHLEGENKPREFLADRKNGVTIVGLILAQLKNLFPVTPIDSLIKASYGSESLNSEVSLLHETLRQAMESLDPNSLESYITIYGFLCDLYGLQYIEEISSYLRATYLTHGFRELNLNDFEHLPIRDLLPLLAALRHNNFFDGITVDGIKLTGEMFEELSHTLIYSQTLKKLKLTNCSLRPEVLFQKCVAWKSSSKSVLCHIDLSKNLLDEKFIDNFCTALESLQHGLQSLVLSTCRISAKVGAQIAQAMKQNQDLLYSLTHLDLSDNPLGPDSQAALAFLKEPQTITTLNLSRCGLNFELVFPVLTRGCQQHLRELNLSQNKINPKKTNLAGVAQMMQQFFSSTISLHVIDLSDCKLTPEIAIAIMEGISVNPNIEDTSLNLSTNELGHGLDVRAMSNVLSRLKKVSTLDISNTGIDLHLSRLVEALGLNRTIRHLSIGQNFEGKGNSRIDGIRQLCRMLKADDCCLETLNVADSKLREYTSAFLSALVYNDSILKLDISGNGMGPPGVRALVKLLLSGTQIQEVHYNNNDIAAAGFTYIADALEHNYTLLSLPTPLVDVSRIPPKEADGVEEALARIQTYLCRNHSDERLGIKLAKRHQLRLLTTAQQSALISREIVQVEEMLGNLSSLIQKPPNYKEEVAKATAIKEEANKVLQLVDSLYSPHKESQQYEAIVNRIQTVLEREVEQLYQEFVQENIESMVTQSVKTCPQFLDDANRETLRQISRRELQSELIEAKKAVTKKTAPEIINHISGMNLETAAVISELIVDKTLDELEGCTGRLHRMSEKVSGSPSKRVSKIFSFRTKDQESPHNKRRRRRDDDDENEDDILLPSSPLNTDGPTLQHLGNQRPRPARRHHHRPAALKQAATSGPASVWDTPTGGIDEVDKPSLESKKQDQEKNGSIPLKIETKTDQDEIKQEQLQQEESKPKSPLKPSAKEKAETTPPKTKPEATPQKPKPEATPQKPKQEATAPAPTKTEVTPTHSKVTPPATPTGESEERQSVESIKRKSGISKLFGSRKEKSSSSPSPTPPVASPSPPPPVEEEGKKKEDPTPSSPTANSATVEEPAKRTSELVADEYVVIPKKNPPPAVRSKPQRPKSGELLEEAAAAEGWKPPGAAASTSVGQLASVLKQGGIPQLKPTKPSTVKEGEKETAENVTAEKQETHRPMAPPVAHKPKRPSAKTKSPEHADSAPSNTSTSASTKEEQEPSSEKDNDKKESEGSPKSDKSTDEDDTTSL